MANNDWKSRLGMVYSTNPDFQFEQEETVEEETLAPKDQKLIIVSSGSSIITKDASIPLMESNLSAA